MQGIGVSPLEQLKNKDGKCCNPALFETIFWKYRQTKSIEFTLLSLNILKTKSLNDAFWCYLK